jgi:hypothetical protein
VTAGPGSTDLFLQIGINGLNNVGENSAATDVVFGALTDPPLNGLTGRNMDSATPEACIVVPEPSTLLLGTVSLLALVVLRLTTFGGKRRLGKRRLADFWRIRQDVARPEVT